MSTFRSAVPVLGILALAALFLKLPEAPRFFSCKFCTANDPYLPLIGAGYFSALAAVSLLFPAFPSRRVGVSGLVWAIGLGVALSYLIWPSVCWLCLFAHGCHIAIWAVWTAFPGVHKLPSASFGERLCVAIFAPLSAVALFSSLNLTFMAYGHRVKSSMSINLHKGDPIPAFAALTTRGAAVASPDAARAGGLVLNFIVPNCPYCKEQLPKVHSVASKVAGYRFINVSPALIPEWETSDAEWIEDRESKLSSLFKVTGYPTLFILMPDGKIGKIILGLPNEFEKSLLAGLPQKTPP